MAFTFPASEFFEQSGNAAYEFQEGLRDGIVRFACEVWQNYPDFVTQGTNPGSSFARGYMNQTCSPIQPAVPPPGTGQRTEGWCSTTYNVFVDYDIRPGGTNDRLPRTDQAFAGLLGPLLDVDSFIFGGDRVRVIVESQPPGNINTYTTSGAGVAEVYDDSVVVRIERVDGQPDNCVPPDAIYGSPPPSDNDLRDTITINNFDGTLNTYEIEYNKITNEYNFPMGFKVNGVNVTLDLGGLTVYGDINITNFGGGQSIPPPGSDGGRTGNGNTITKIYPESEQIILPKFNPLPQAEEALSYLVCDEGSIEIVQEVVKVISGQSLASKLILKILDNIVQDLCGQDEAVIGLPEYYDLKSGIERPAIVFLWKEYINNTWQARTYSSTVSNPSASAISSLSTISVPDKTIGQFRKTLTLTSGGKIVASGNTEASRDANFQFLLNLVDSSVVPPDTTLRTIESRDLRLQEVTVKCRKIEYYPNGKKDNVSAAFQRYIDV